MRQHKYKYKWIDIISKYNISVVHPWGNAAPYLRPAVIVEMPPQFVRPPARPPPSRQAVAVAICKIVHRRVAFAAIDAQPPPPRWRVARAESREGCAPTARRHSRVCVFNEFRSFRLRQIPFRSATVPERHTEIIISHLYFHFVKK